MSMQDYSLNEYWKSLSSNLGGVYPYYNTENNDLFSLKFADVLAHRRSNKLSIELDPGALVTKLYFPHLFGDRTLVKGVSRAPWMAEYKDEGEWQPHLLPEHGNSNPDPEVFTLKLKNALIDEASRYISGKSNIGILLSGGMDSRVVAGILRELQIRKVDSIKIIALTWGDEKSRDVVYARRIAEQFNWEVIHFPLTVDTLASNISCAGVHGAEFSPFHLHAMESVANTQGIDAIIAGSYGDSVGRAEFSGTHVTKVKSMLPHSIDPYGFIKSKALGLAKKDLMSDLIDSDHFSASMPILRRREIEQEMHYMRRMLQSCMQTIALKTPIYQLFTAPEVFGLMWSLEPTVRNNDWYTHLLSILPGELLEIPWARTGARYDKPNDSPSDNLTKSYHQYGKWLRNDLKEEVLKRVNSEHIYGLGIFNEKGLERLINNWEKANTLGINRLDESVAWLCSLHDMIEMYDIPKMNVSYEDNFMDSMRSYIGNAKASTFINIRNKFRK